MKFQNKLILALLLSVISLSFAQKEKEITGQIIDEITQEGIVFATLKIKGQNNGVVADEKGYFRLPYKYKTTNNVLVISSIGYRSLEIPINTLKDNMLNVLGLESKTESLDGVVIQGTKKKIKNYIPPRLIVDKAIKSIPSNYPQTSHSYIAYYRDYQLLKNKYFNLNESIMEVFDAGFHTNALLYKDNQTALFNFKANLDFPKDSILASAYSEDGSKFIEGATIDAIGGNELSILNVHNAIRNYAKKSFSFVNVFKDNFVSNHEFRLEKKVYLDDIPLYQIKFFAKEDVTGVKNSADGVIYIDYNTYAIHKLEYYGYKANDLIPFYSVKIEYKPLGNKMYLNYISFNNRFDVRSEDDFKVNDVTFDKTDNSFYITFNNKINLNTIKNKKNFRFIYKRKKLKISKIIPTSDKVLKITLIKGTLPSGDVFNKESMKDLVYKIKRVEDAVGRKLGKVTKTQANQFREIFVQEVFENREKPSWEDIIFVNKNDILLKSMINENNESLNKYWVNSPLKKTKE